jgi:hypothetical protein
MPVVHVANLEMHADDAHAERLAQEGNLIADGGRGSTEYEMVLQTLVE